MRPECFFLIFALLTCGMPAQHNNRFNKAGERTGRWIVFNDSAKKSLSMNVRFRKGNAVGKGYYYTLGGALARKEVIRFRKIKTVFYYPGGAMRMKGQTRIENEAEKVHYYFYGKWKYYDENGKLLKYGEYEKGKLVQTTYINGDDKFKDSIVSVLQSFEKSFRAKNRELIFAVDKQVYNPSKAEICRQQLVANDSLIFLAVAGYLDAFGYPEVQVAGESASVPFFIMSYATNPMREKYLVIFERAVLKGDLSAKTLAFFIDKLKLGRGEKQVYGTQFYYDKDRKVVVYPTTDPVNLEKRRESVGLN